MAGSVSMDESEDDIEMSLYPPGSEVPLDICERIIAKSKTVSRMLLSHVQLDPVTLSSLVARNVITNGKAVLLRNTSDTPDERVFNILRPALLSGGKVSLQAFYRTLLETKEGRLGHVALAEAIKKKVDAYLKKVSERSSSRSRSNMSHTRRRVLGGHVSETDSDASDVHPGLLETQHLYGKQYSLPHDVEHDTHKRVASSVLLRHHSDDGTYRSRPTLQPIASDMYPNSDSSSVSSYWDKVPDDTTDGSGSGSKGQTRQQPNALSMLTAQEAKYVEEFKAEYGEVRTSLIEALQQNRRLQESPALLAVMLSVVDSGKVAGSNPQISDVVDVWIGKKVKDFSLFTMAMGLACVQGLGRYITCIAQKIGPLTGAELVHFTNALGHSWTMFAQKIGYEENELKVEGAAKLSKTAFFSQIWLVPKFDSDQLKDLLCELLITIQEEDALRSFRNKLFRAASRDGLAALSRSTSNDTISSLLSSEFSGSETDSSTTDTETPSESDGSMDIHRRGQSRLQPVLSMLTAEEAKYVEEFKAEHGEVRTSLIEALQQNRHLQESPAQLAVMLSVVDSGKVAGSNPQISDVVDVWIGKKVKDFSLFTMAMGLACVQGLGRYITCIAHKIGPLTGAELVHFTKALGHSWTMFAQKIGYEQNELKVEGASKLSKKAFFSQIWLVPKFDSDQLKNLFCELLKTVQEEDVLRNFMNRLSRAASRGGLAALDTSISTFTMSSLPGLEAAGSESDSSTTETETPSESDVEGPRKYSSATVVEQNGDSFSAKVASQSDSGLPSSSWRSSALSAVASLSASSVPPPCEDLDSSATLVDKGEWSSSDESTIAQGFFDEEDSSDASTLMVYDRSAIFFGPDIVPPMIPKRSEIAGLYKLLKEQPFDQELFEVMLVSESSLVHRLTEDDRSLLFLACELNNAEAVTLLLKNGANPNLQDKYGRTCLHLLSVYWNEIIFWALVQNENTNVNVATFKTQITPLCVACLMKEVPPVKRLLEKGADPNGAEETTCPPIVLAAREGAYQVVQELLAHGASVDKPNAGGYTALHLAAFEDHTQIVELLLAHMSDPNRQATNCATALSCAVANGHTSTARMLLDKGANVNATRTITHDGVLAASEVSALAEGALGGHADVVLLLLEEGADMHFKSEGYLSVLTYACIGGSADVVRQLMIHGNMKNRPSELVLPLQSAMQYQNFRCAKVLVEEAGGMDALRRALRYESQLLQDLNSISALLSSGGEEMMNMGDRVPKSVGRTDDAFQKCRSRSLNATIEEVKLAELFDPDESVFYEGLVQYIVEKHIILTAELMAGEQNLLSEAESSGANEVADFIRQYKANLIHPSELSLKLNCTSPPVIAFYCRHVDLVHLEQYARSTDNRIALQYFLEMHRRRDMGHLTGFGLQMSSYGTPFQSGFDSQDFADMQMAGFHPGLGAGIQTMTLRHGLHGDRSTGMGPASSYRQGLSAPLSVPRNTASISRDPVPVKTKAKSAEAPSPPEVKDGSTTTARPPQKDPKFAGGDPMVPKKTLHAEVSNSVCAEASAPTMSSEPSQSQSSATQLSQNDPEETDVLTETEDNERSVGTQARELCPPQASNDSGIVADSTGQKTYRKTKRRSHKEDVPTSEDDTNASVKHPPKGWKKKGNDSDSGDSDPESTADELWSDSESLSSVSTISQSMSKKTPDSAHMKTALTYDGVGVRSPKSVLQESGEILTSVESRSSVVQGSTAKVPSVPPLVKQECSADPPSNRMPLAHAASSDDKVTLAEVHSPVPPDKTSGLGTEELPILTEDECPPLYAPDTGSALKLDPSSDDHASLLGSFKPQHESAAVEVFEKDVTVRKSDENVKSDNHVSTTDENATRTDTASKTDENVSASDLTSVASVNEIQRHSLESTPVSHEPETTMQQSSMRCLRVPLRPPDHIAQMLVKDSPDECIDHRRSKHRLLLSMICSSIKQRWSMLARRLGLQENDVQDIKKNCDTSEGRGMAVVMKWVEQSKDRTDSGNDSSPATWHQLAVCLAFIRRVDLVHLIRSRLLATEPAEKEALSSSDIIDITSPHNLCILRHVAVSIAERWSILARHLRVNRDSVGPCDAYNDSTSMCFAVLMLWLSEQQGKDGTTFEMLFAHLRNMDCDHLVGEALLIGASECTC